MSRNEIISQLQKFFDTEELVCNHTRSKWGDKAWQFLDTEFLHVLLIIRRDILKAPMWCNNYKSETYQRGLRCNRCGLVRNKQVVYLSSHILGKAGDFTVQGMTAEEAREKIKASAHLLPCPIRMEDGVSWLHFDVLPQWGVSAKVYEFKA